MRPAQAGQIIDERMRQIAGILVLHDVGRAGALGQLGALLVEDHRHVRELGHRCIQRFIDIDLARGVVDVVVAADDLGDAHVPVVHHHRKVVGGKPVRAEDHHVVELAVGDLDASLDQVVEHHRTADGILEADHAIGVVAIRQVLLAGSAVVTRLFLLGHGGLAHGVEFLAGFVGVIRLALREQLLGDFLIAGNALGLVDRAFVVTQPQPVHRFQDGVDRFLRAALAVGVLDAQHELAAAVACLQPAIQGGAGAADMQVTGGAGSETGAAGHGALGKTGVARFYLAQRGPARPVAQRLRSRSPYTTQSPPLRAVPGASYSTSQVGILPARCLGRLQMASARSQSLPCGSTADSSRSC